MCRRFACIKSVSYCQHFVSSWMIQNKRKANIGRAACTLAICSVSKIIREKTFVFIASSNFDKPSNIFTIQLECNLCDCGTDNFLSICYFQSFYPVWQSNFRNTQHACTYIITTKNSDYSLWRHPWMPPPLNHFQ